MTESALYPAIIGALSRGPTRLWRQQSALSWQGTVLERTPLRLVLANPRAIRAGLPGMADIGGLTLIEITPNMVGRWIGQAVQIECKSGRKQLTEEQGNFIAVVRSLGARAGVARSLEDADAIVRGL